MSNCVLLGEAMMKIILDCDIAIRDEAMNSLYDVECNGRSNLFVCMLSFLRMIRQM